VQAAGAARQQAPDRPHRPRVSAMSASTLTVTPGTFSGSTYTTTKAITVQCQATDYSCILDGEDSRRVIYVRDVSSGTTNFIGLKITRGGGGNWGAGIYIGYSDATITNCIISDNDAGGNVSTCGEVHLNSLLFVRMINLYHITTQITNNYNNLTIIAEGT